MRPQHFVETSGAANAFWRSIVYSSGCLRSPHLKRLALHDAHDQRRKTVIVRAGVAHDFAHGGHVVGLEAAAERVGQHLFGHGADENFGTAEQSLAKTRWAVD